MFIFLSQCNKKCTSFPNWVRGSAVVGRPTAPVDRGMLYVAYQMHTDIMVPVRTWAGMVVNSGGAPLLSDHPAMRNLTAVYELISRAGLTHTRPPFGIGSVTEPDEHPGELAALPGKQRMLSRVSRKADRCQPVTLALRRRFEPCREFRFGQSGDRNRAIGFVDQ